MNHVKILFSMLVIIFGLILAASVLRDDPDPTPETATLNPPYPTDLPAIASDVRAYLLDRDTGRAIVEGYTIEDSGQFIYLQQNYSWMLVTLANDVPVLVVCLVTSPPTACAEGDAMFPKYEPTVLPPDEGFVPGFTLTPSNTPITLPPEGAIVPYQPETITPGPSPTDWNILTPTVATATPSS